MPRHIHGGKPVDVTCDDGQKESDGFRHRGASVYYCSDVAGLAFMPSRFCRPGAVLWTHTVSTYATARKVRAGETLSTRSPAQREKETKRSGRSTASCRSFASTFALSQVILCLGETSRDDSTSIFSVENVVV